MAFKIDPLNVLFNDLAGQLGKDDEKKIRQLLEGKQISKRDMEQLQTPVEIFRRLVESGFISNSNLEFLKDLFNEINRGPLVTGDIKKYESEHIPGNVSKQVEVNPLKKLFGDLSGQLDADDERTIRYLLTNQQISKRDMMKINDPADIFNKLVESGFITEDNLEFLKTLFRTMNRTPLVRFVEEFERKQVERKFFR